MLCKSAGTLAVQPQRCCRNTQYHTCSRKTFLMSWVSNALSCLLWQICQAHKYRVWITAMVGDAERECVLVDKQGRSSQTSAGLSWVLPALARTGTLTPISPVPGTLSCLAPSAGPCTLQVSIPLSSSSAQYVSCCSSLLLTIGSSLLQLLSNFTSRVFICELHV